MINLSSPETPKKFKSENKSPKTFQIIFKRVKIDEKHREKKHSVYENNIVYGIYIFEDYFISAAPPALMNQPRLLATAQH